jgi:putative membrane protein insertion efficiency factor
MIRFLIRFYQVCISPLVGVNCRFVPSCSQYALEATREHGALKGSLLTAKRLCRCHPFGGHGHDPVPTADGVK